MPAGAGGATTGAHYCSGQEATQRGGLYFEFVRWTFFRAGVDQCLASQSWKHTSQEEKHKFLVLPWLLISWVWGMHTH